jgi:RHS repeat-associated protein
VKTATAHAWNWSEDESVAIPPVAANDLNYSAAPQLVLVRTTKQTPDQPPSPSSRPLPAQTRTTIKSRNTSIDKHLGLFLLQTPHLHLISAHIYKSPLSQCSRAPYMALGRTAARRSAPRNPAARTYDAVGNLTSKTGVGTANGNLGATYQYPVQGAAAIRPHAVISIPGLSGGSSFGYDDNGNLTSGAGRTLTWTSFDMPNSITKAATQTTPAASASFVYGPEHQRTRQTRVDGGTTTSVIYAGAQEVETKAGVTTIKTYWPYGVGVEIDRNLSGNANPNNNTSELNWTHTDRLGSPVAMSTTTGTLREKLAYDAWGKRRTLDGAPIGVGNNATPTPDNLDGQTDNRGFTGHEMLDGLDLVHMNGRIYDPLTARFMSADPILQDPMNGQSYNRYSYVMNNPTNFTDPTGFTANIIVATATRLFDSSVVCNGSACAGWLREAIAQSSAAATALAQSARNVVQQVQQVSAKLGGAAIKVAKDRGPKIVGKALVKAGAAAGTGATGIGIPVAAVLTGAGLVDLAYDLYEASQEVSTIMSQSASESGDGSGAVSKPAEGGAEQPKRDGEGATEEEVKNSSGGESAGKPVPQKLRDKIIEEGRGEDGKWTCWRCGGKLSDEGKVDIGHKNVPRSEGGNLHPDNLGCEGRACNRSAGNRGYVKPGSSCVEKGCGK